VKRITGILAITLVLILALSSIGCGEKKVESAEPGEEVTLPVPAEEKVTPPVPAEAKLEILSHRRTTAAEFGEEASPESGYIVIVGTAKNVSGDTLSQIQVKARFFDEEGGIVEPTLHHASFKGYSAKTRNLPPGEIWEFVIRPNLMPDTSVHHYEVELGIVY